MFSDIMSSNFGKEFTRDNIFHADIAYEPWHIQDAFKIYSYRCFSSHALRATSLPQETIYPFVGISMVRDPKSLAASCYFDMRNRVSGPHHPTQNMTVQQLTKAWRDTGFKSDYAYSVPQLKWLYPNVDSAIERVHCDIEAGRLLLFPQDRFDESMVCLERLFSQSFCDCSYGAKSNVSLKDHTLSAQDIASIESLPWISEDEKLLSIAHDFLDDLIKAVFAVENEFETSKKQFLLRCGMKTEARGATLPVVSNDWLKKINKYMRILMR